MPRINIDDKLFADDRFIELVAEIGNRAETIGVCVILFQMGQRYWVNNRALIPPSIFKKIPRSELIEKVGLVRRKRAGIYVRGSEAYFEWIRSRVDSSRKGGESMKKKWAGGMPVASPLAPALVKIEPLDSAKQRALEKSMEKLNEEMAKRDMGFLAPLGQIPVP